jgi:hypothetical protein
VEISEAVRVVEPAVSNVPPALLSTVSEGSDADPVSVAETESKETPRVIAAPLPPFRMKPEVTSARLPVPERLPLVSATLKLPLETEKPPSAKLDTLVVRVHELAPLS